MLQDLLGGNDPSPVDGAAGIDQPGAEEPHVGSQNVDPFERSVNRDAETLEQAQARAVTAEQRARKADETNAANREAIAKAALERSIQARESEREEAEKSARLNDAQAVEDGDLSPQEMIDNADKRRREADQNAQIEQNADKVLENLQTYGSTGVRYEEAVKLATKHNLVDVRPLMDKSITSVVEMEARAAQLAEDARTGNETFDGGRSGSPAPANTAGMHGLQLAVAAYSPEETAKRNRSKRR